MATKRTILSLALALTLSLSVGLAQAGTIEFGGASGLLGTGGLALGVNGTADLGYSSTTRTLDAYGLSGVSMTLSGFSWYGVSSWLSGANPGAGTPANLMMTEYRNEYGLAVGNTAASQGLPATGVNEIDSREGLVLTFSQPVYLSSVTLGNFYNDTSSWTGKLESGWLVLDGQYAMPLDFTVPVGQFVSGGGTGSYAGTYVVSLPSAVQVSSISFFSSGQISGESWSSDFLVRSVDASKTPEPASLVLMGSAAGLMWWRRRKQS